MFKIGPLFKITRFIAGKTQISTYCHFGLCIGTYIWCWTLNSRFFDRSMMFVGTAAVLIAQPRIYFLRCLRSLIALCYHMNRINLVYTHDKHLIETAARSCIPQPPQRTGSRFTPSGSSQGNCNPSCPAAYWHVQPISYICECTRRLKASHRVPYFRERCPRRPRESPLC